MADILHRIKIKAPPERVYEALTTEQGLADWWTKDVKIRIDSIAEFGFNNHSLVTRMLTQR